MEASRWSRSGWLAGLGCAEDSRVGESGDAHPHVSYFNISSIFFVQTQQIIKFHGMYIQTTIGNVQNL
jgi:hypothetical protein